MLCLAFFGLRVSDPGGVFDRFRLSILDLYSFAGHQTPSTEVQSLPDVHLIEIDDVALTHFGQWPWPRDRLAEILIQLYEKGVSTVGVDLLLAEPDRLSPERFLSRYPVDTSELDRFKNSYGYLDTDEFLADVLAQTPTVLAVASGESSPGQFSPSVGLAWINAVPDNVPELPGLLIPTPTIAASNVTTGHIVVAPDADGMLRRIPVLLAVEGKIYTSLFASVLSKMQGDASVLIKGAKDQPEAIETLKIGGFEVPVDEAGRFRLLPELVVSEQDGLPLLDVLQGAHDDVLNGAVVILGPTALGLMDFHDTPGALSVPGPALHVAAIRQVFEGRYLLRNDVIQGLEWVSALGLVLFCIAITSFANSWISSLGFVLSVGANYGLGVYLYTHHGFAFDWSLGALSAFLAFGSATAISLVRTESERGEIKKAFSTYLSPDLVAQLANDPGKLKLGGERKELSILFADIRGFTSMSEKYADKPEELTVLLNDLLTPLTDVVLSTNGTIDKYMGDAIMAFWNAPLDVEDHAEQACATAIQLMSALDTLNNTLIETGRIEAPLRIGIGINTGEVTVGNLGSDQRFDYSCLGDPVNLASRLEGLSKAYGVPVIVGEATINHLRKTLTGAVVLKLDIVRVVGKSIPQQIFGLIPVGLKEPAWCALHQKLTVAIERSDWEEVSSCIQTLASEEHYPPPLLEQANWRLQTQTSGARQMTSK